MQMAENRKFEGLKNTFASVLAEKCLLEKLLKIQFYVLGHGQIIIYSAVKQLSSDRYLFTNQLNSKVNLRSFRVFLGKFSYRIKVPLNLILRPISGKFCHLDEIKILN